MPPPLSAVWSRAAAGCFLEESCFCERTPAREDGVAGHARALARRAKGLPPSPRCLQLCKAALQSDF